MKLATTIQHQQLALIQERWSPATMEAVGDGAHMVVVPDMPLIDGWNRASVTVRFLVPKLYPSQRPYGFWADDDIRYLDDSGHILSPQCTHHHIPAPLCDKPLTFFYWRLQAWSPIHDTLLTYVHVIRRRLQILK